MTNQTPDTTTPIDWAKLLQSTDPVSFVVAERIVSQDGALYGAQFLTEFDAYTAAAFYNSSADRPTPGGPVHDILSDIGCQLAELIAYLPGDSLVDIGDALEDVVHEVADGAVPIYNADRFAACAELDRYELDDAGLCEEGDMIQMSGAILYEWALEVIGECVASVADYIATEALEVEWDAPEEGDAL